MPRLAVWGVVGRVGGGLRLVTCCSSWGLGLGGPGGLLSGRLAGPPRHSVMGAHPWFHLQHEGQGCSNPDQDSPPSFSLTLRDPACDGRSLLMPSRGAFQVTWLRDRLRIQRDSDSSTESRLALEGKSRVETRVGQGHFPESAPLSSVSTPTTPAMLSPSAPSPGKLSQVLAWLRTSVMAPGKQNIHGVVSLAPSRSQKLLKGLAFISIFPVALL